jgi:uncharacterized damage-inducible protein DinB
MSIAATLIDELEMDRFTWSPHPKSRSLGHLAMHVAQNPGSVMSLAAQNPADLPAFGDTMPASTAELLEALDVSVAEAKRLLGAMSDTAITETWRVRRDGVEIMAMPRIAFLRSVFLNHWYHHRGQLTVYLRQLDVPIPSIYGPSADENPFG